MSWPTAGILPGGGPWRILDDCPAQSHNTQRAAKRPLIGQPCVCPRGLKLKERANQSRAQREANAEAGEKSRSLSGKVGAAIANSAWKRARPMWAIGNGPWLIEPACTAVVHNSSTAAKLRGVEKCICPRTLKIREAYRQTDSTRKREQKRAAGTLTIRRSSDVVMTQVASASYLSNILGKNRPDLTGAACANDLGRKVMDRFFHEGSKATAAEAKAICNDCPVRRACGEWALGEEVDRFGQPAGGTWDGMYGGMTPVERKKLTMPRVSRR